MNITKQLFRWSTIKNIARRAERRMSLRVKISLGLLGAMILIIPAIFASLYYFNHILEMVAEITEKDVQIIQLADQISLKIIEARRTERNYELLRDQTQLDRNRALIKEIINHTTEGIRIVGGDSILFVQIREAARDYSSYFDNFVEKVNESAPIDRVRSLRSGISRAFTEFNTVYQDLLNKAQMAEGAARDSLSAAAKQYADEFSFDNLFSEISATSDAETRIIKEVMDQSSNQISSIADMISRTAHDDVKSHEQMTRELNARAKRNIVMLIILTGIGSIYLVIQWPPRVIRPLILLTNALERAAAGDPMPVTETRFDHEMRELIIWYNRFATRTKKLNQLRAGKISAQQKRIQLLLNHADNAWMIFNPDLTITTLNEKARVWLELDGDIIDKKLTDIEDLNSLRGVLRREMERFVHSTTEQVEIRFRMPKNRRIRAILHFFRTETLDIEGLAIQQPPKTT